MRGGREEGREGSFGLAHELQSRKDIVLLQEQERKHTIGRQYSAVSCIATRKQGR